MNSATINQINSIMQEASEGTFTMQGLALTKLLHRVIREYGKYDGVNYTVYLADIDTADQKLLLSHVCDSCDYADICVSPTYLDAMWKENASYIQELIDQECHEVYCEDMEEMGMKRIHSIDDERLWIRR
jgi:hypothetical protein